MTVILVLATFLVFILLDYYLSPRPAERSVAATSTRSQLAALAPHYVEGFLTPKELRYHPGHSWALCERRRFYRVGVDEFASALLGNLSQIELPKPGRWIRQGQPVWAFHRDGETSQMISPVEGEVAEVNPAVSEDPSLLRTDPYGRGWLMTVQVPDEETTQRNLVPSFLTTGWMREAVSRLYAQQPQLAGAAAADGGRPVRDLAESLPDKSWKELTREFFLT